MLNETQTPSAEMKEGLIVKEQSGFYWVEIHDGDIIRCQLRGRLKEAAQSADIAAIGDRVHITENAQEDGTDIRTGVIEQVEARHSSLSRARRTSGKRGAGQAEREHILIANADQVVLVFSAAQPAPNLRMLDRMLVAYEASTIERCLIVFNKVDLEDPSTIDALSAPYAQMGYPLLHTSALQGRGVDVLRERLRDQISVFTGPSGVGKTSLLNQIQPGLARAVRSVSTITQEGTHTTRDSALIKLDVGGYLADTPGIRSLAVWDVEPDELDGYFRDIAAYVDRCKFRDCTHTNEPGCAVRQAVADGAIHRNRYANFLHLRDELRETYIVY